MNRSSEQTFSMRWICAGILVVMVGVMISGRTAHAEQQQSADAAKSSAPAGDVDKGKKAFEKNGCFACHGHSGDGGYGIYHTQAGFRSPRPDVVGARLAGMSRSFASFVSYVRKPAGRMPAFRNQITDAELADIYAFLKSVPPSPDPKSIPLLNGQ